MKQHNSAGIFVYRLRRGGADSNQLPEFLILKSKWGKHWSIPKGHRDTPKESILGTALRETEEETGFSQEDIQLIGDYQQTVEYRLRRRTRNCPDGIKKVALFVGKVDADAEVALSREHTAYKWVGLHSGIQHISKDFKQAMMEAYRVIRKSGQ